MYARTFAIRVRANLHLSFDRLVTADRWLSIELNNSTGAVGHHMLEACDEFWLRRIQSGSAAPDWFLT